MYGLHTACLVVHYFVSFPRFIPGHSTTEMPLLEQALQPGILTTLSGPHPPSRPYLIFYADVDRESGKMWCGDCRDVDDVVKAHFEAPDGPTGIIIRVGDKPTWKDPQNQYRQLYKISSIPTIIRLEEGQEAGRLVEGEISEGGLQRLSS